MAKRAESTESTRELAERIADDLMRNGNGDVAQRLVWESPGGRTGGGYSRFGLISCIEKTLAAAIKP